MATAGDTIAQSVCSVKSCSQPSAGEAARTNSLLCRKHLNDDVDKVRHLRLSVKEKVQKVTDNVDIDGLRKKQHSLAAEMQQLDEKFDQLHRCIDACKKRIDTKLQPKNQALLSCLQLCNELQQYEKDVLQAEQAANMRSVFHLVTEMELVLDSTHEQFELCGGVEKMKAAVDVGSVRAVGDVSGGVKELEFVIDRHMRGVVELCEDEDCRSGSEAAAPAAAAAAVCEDSSSVVELDGEVIWVTSCSNTDGFVGDKSGRVIRGSLGDEDTVQLPQPCLFVSYLNAEKKDHLTVTSTDGSVKLRCHFDIDWNKCITGLHCDSRRQLLFVAQWKTVTVTDLSGCVTRVISDTTLGHTVGDITGIDGNDDKVFVFDCKEKKLLGMSKDTGELETVIAVPHFHAGGWGSLSLLDNKILLTDRLNGKVHKVCIITKQLVTSYPTRCSDITTFRWPADVAVDSRGLMFISEFLGHVVRVVLNDGTVVQTLGTDGEAGSDRSKFNRPCGLTVVEGATRSHLIVADRDNKRLRVFDLL